MKYQHKDPANTPINLPLGKIICIGRNYLEHIQELKNQKPEKPVIFIKPATSLCSLAKPIQLPSYSTNCHHEIELAVLIQKKISNIKKEKVDNAIWGYGLALDLTLRDVQVELKEKGLPWEMAKAFDGACPISVFVPAHEIQEPQNLSLSLKINSKVHQQGNTKQMIFSIKELISYVSKYFTLMPGDVVLTGTPAGVGPLHANDQLICCLDKHLKISTVIS